MAFNITLTQRLRDQFSLETVRTLSKKLRFGGGSGIRLALYQELARNLDTLNYYSHRDPEVLSGCVVLRRIQRLLQNHCTLRELGERLLRGLNLGRSRVRRLLEALRK